MYIYTNQIKLFSKVLLNIRHSELAPASPLEREKIVFVSSFVPRSLLHPGPLGPSQSPPHRLFVLLESQGVGHPLSVPFNLAGGMTGLRIILVIFTCSEDKLIPIEMIARPARQ